MIQYIKKTNIPLPSALLRPLKFGDREQINAINDVEFIMEKAEARERADLNGELKKFMATVSFSGRISYPVWAMDEEDAKMEAQNRFEEQDFESETDINSVKVEVKK